jgi:hypothetical protein
MANQIQLNHKRLASGLFYDDTVNGDATWVDPGWTGVPLYTSIAPSGSDLKYLLFHNADSSNWIDTRIYFYGTGIDNRVLYLSIPPDETAEWDLDYVIHLDSGQSIYGNVPTDYGIGGSTVSQPLNYYIYGAEIVTGDLQGS